MFKIVQFSRNEIKDLTITIIVITLLFAYLFSSNGSIGLFILLIPLSFITVGLSFVLHELGHKYMAQKYGFYAEFKRWDLGLIIAVITGICGFVFLAPGAVYITSYTGYISEKENGMISAAGPIINIILAIIFLLVGIAIKPLVLANIFGTLYISLICTLGFSINSLISFFNLLPIPSLDGSKIIKWNMPLWLIMIIISGIFIYLSHTITFI